MYTWNSYTVVKFAPICVVFQSPTCRIKQQGYYPETECVCGALPGGWPPHLVFDPWQTAQSLEGIIQ